MVVSFRTSHLALFALFLLYFSPVAAFGAGNIASISKIEGHNWRHGDIEDMLKTIAFIKGSKWTNMMIKRVYFGNWLRDYSQAIDVGSLKGIQAGTIRILVWVLSFLSFGYATGEFEVTEERLGVYRPEEHIDNPKNYADDVDARNFDSRLRPPVQQVELEVDPATGMKNYIANENLAIATSAGYIKFSFSRSIHFGRLYTNGANGTKSKEADLCEALRCLGQGLHCLEDFGAHTNYTELALREMGHGDVFPHTGSATKLNLRGAQHPVFPLVTGTFGVVDFLFSIIGEFSDNVAQTEVEQLDIALKDAEARSKTSEDGSLPGAGDLAHQAQDLEAMSNAQKRSVDRSTSAFPVNERFERPPGSQGGPPGPNIPGTNIDPMKTAAQIYPILEFRDKVARLVASTIEKVPGLEALVEKITETLTLFVLALLAPFIRPIIMAVSAQLKAGSGGVIDASGKHQYEPWEDPHCSDPTHSLLSKDHFSNILNEPAGQVASTILQYVAPRIVFAWEHPDIPVDQVLNDIIRVFHHPAIRDSRCELHQKMYSTVEHWARSRPDGGANLNVLLGSDSVRRGRNHTVNANQQSHSHDGLPSASNLFGAGSHSKVRDAHWDQIGRVRGGLDQNAIAENVAQDNRQSQQGTHHQLVYPPNTQQEPQAYRQSRHWQPDYGGFPPQQHISRYEQTQPYGYDPNGPPSPQPYGYGGPQPRPEQNYGRGPY